MLTKPSVIVISLTPFDDGGRVDENAYRAHLGRLRAAGVSVYVAGSGTSEAYTFTPEERDRVLAISVEELKGRVPVLAMGCEPHTAGEMISFLQAAEKAGVDAAQIFSLDIGHGSKPTYAELDRYYAMTISSTSLPVLLSSHHAAGYYLPIRLIEDLADRHSNLVGLAYGGNDIPHLAELIERFADRMQVRCAGPANALTVLGLGGHGFMGGEGNLSPRLVQSVIDNWLKRDLNAVAESFSKLMALARIYTKFNGGSSMRSMKPLMQALGLPAGALRLPRLPIPQDELAIVVEAVRKLDIDLE